MNVLFLAISLATVPTIAYADVLDIQIDRKATLVLDGAQVLVTGTVTCDVSPDTTFTNSTIFPAVVQLTKNGKIVNVAFAPGTDNFPCSDPTTPSPYALLIPSAGVTFKPGQAIVGITVQQVLCNSIECRFSNKNLNQPAVLNP
ncbi:hypothetical protein ACFW0H_01075 [Pseudomonas sp. CR3202]|uniref:hypothetical protein n=1 Tax=Pseudomonas sp. CR3202 TaxID=3351532 RepID=UPI003BF3A92F